MLVALFVRDGAAHAVLTRRREHLRAHAGEISFPGGRREPGDADLLATALREAQEEIGLPPCAVEVVGALSATPTAVSRFLVHPFVGVIDDGHAWRPAADEVADVLELPLAQLRSVVRRERIVRGSRILDADVYPLHRDGAGVVWGATARILGELLALAP